MTPKNLIVHCLIDPRRDSMLPIHLVTQGVQPANVRICAPIHYPTVVESINQSHKAIVSENTGAPYICIMEQDCLFPAADGLEQWLYYHSHHQPLYLGGCYNMPNIDKIREIHARPPALPFITCSGLRSVEGFHCYILMPRAYSRFLELPDNEHVDVAAIREISATVIYPFCAVQMPGYSSTAGRVTNKNEMLNAEDVYGPIPSV